MTVREIGLIVLLGLAAVLFEGCVESVTVLQDYDVSDICDNLSLFQGKDHFEGKMIENNETVIKIERFNLVNGIVVFGNYSERNRAGIIVITGKKQIRDNETLAKFIAIAVKNPDQVKNLNVGSVVALQNNGINWQSQVQDGKKYWFVNNPGSNLVKTGQVSADDPIYDDVQKAIQEFQRKQDEDTALLVMYYYYILFLNPASPMSPFYG